MICCAALCYISIWMYVCMPVYLYVCMPVCLYACNSVCVCVCVCLSVCVSAYILMYIHVCVCVCPSIESVYILMETYAHRVSVLLISAHHITYVHL